VRSVAKDDLWLSPCYGRNSIGIHFTWKPDEASVRKLLPRIEEALAPFEARPHWGKLFTMPPERVKALYDKHARFRDLLLRWDPQGKFRNEYLSTYIF
jgi:xylitol oxidase